jgi:hypothetical protein
MANEFVARNGLIAQDNSIISGSLIVTNGITGSISGTGSYANNANSASYSLTATSSSYAVNASSAVSSSYALDATSASFATTASYWTGSVNAITSSFATNAGLLNSTGSNGFTTTGSFQTYTASNDLINTTQSARLTSLEGVSASLLSYTQSNNANIASIYGATSSLQSATSSIQAFSSSILSYTASTDNRIGALNSFSSSILSYTSSTDARISSINLATASLNFQTASLLSYTSSTDAKIASIYNNTSSLNAFSGSILNYTSSTDAKISALYTYTSSLNNKTSSFATTGSNTFIGTQTITGSLNISGSINATGTLTAQTLIVQVITSSQDFVTGSTKFGTLTSNTHQFTGSVSASGSLNINSGVLFAGGTSVGIGTTNPQNLLHLGVSAGNKVGIQIGQASRGTGFIGMQAASSVPSTFVIGADVTSSIIFGHGVSETDLSMSTERMRIASGGNVGIGTTDPANKLSVNGNISSTSGNLHTNRGRVAFSSTAGDANHSIYNNYNNIDGEGLWDGMKFNVYAGASFRVGDAASATPTTALYINSSGNVGIGTTNPGFPLFVYRGGGSVDTIVMNGDVGYNVGLGIYKGGSQKWAVYSSNIDTFNIYNTGLNSIVFSILSGSGNVGIGTTSPGRPLDVVGSIRTQAGTVDFSNDTNNQIWVSTSNMNFKTNGSEKMTILSGGNVGIGTTSPQTRLAVGNGSLADTNVPLQISSQGNATQAFIGINKNGGYGLLLGYNETTGSLSGIGAYIRQVSTDPLHFAVNNTTTAMTILSSGNVGIGSTSPAYKLDVNGGAADTTIGVQTTGQNPVRLRLKNEERDFILTNNPADNLLSFNYDGANRFQFDTTNQWFNSGNVGIGTTSPASKLTIQSNSTQLRLETASDPSAYHSFIESNYNAANPLNIVSSAAASYVLGTIALDGITGVNTYLNSYYGIIFGTSTTQISSGTVRMMITNGGNVGIGTTSPLNKLHVAGTSRFTDEAYFTDKLGVGTTSLTYKAEVAGAIGNYWDGSAFTGTPLALAISNTTAGGYDPVLLYRQADSGGTTKLAGGIGLVGRSSWTAGNNGTQVSDMYFLVRNDSGGITERMRISSGGSLGINTTFSGINTASQLTIKASVTDGNQIYIVQSNDDRGWRFKAKTDGHFYLQSAYSSGNSDNLMIQYDTGNVGIGTTSPGAKLHINGSTLQFRITGNSNTFSTYAWGGGINIYSTENMYFGRDASTNNKFYFQNTAGTSTTMYVNTATGNVGLGTEGPGSKLTIYEGDIRLYKNHIISDSATWKANINFTDEVDRLGARITGERTAWDGAPMGLGFDTGGVGTVTRRMTITSGGSVGIGTTSPSSLLHVSGSGGRLVRIEGPSNQDNYLSIFSGGIEMFIDADTTNSSGIVGTQSNHNLILRTNGTNKVWVTTGGNVGIGSTSPVARLDVISSTASTTAPTLYLSQNAAFGQISALDPFHSLILRGIPAGTTGYDVTAGDQMSFVEYGGDFRFYQKAAGAPVLQGRLNVGTFTVTGDIIAYGSPSDISLKTNIKPLEGALEKIMKLKGVSFTWKEDTDTNKMTGIKDDIGFIAQEVQEVLPDLVRKNDNGLLSLRDKGITALLVEAIKELNAKIDRLENK